MIGDNGQVWFEVEIKQNFRKQEIGAKFRVNETGIFTDPANTCALGKVAFEDWTCIHISERAGAGTAEVVYGIGELLERWGEPVVIILMASVAGDSP